MIIRNDRNGTRNNSENNYLDKFQRSNLVEKQVSDCPICMTSSIELILYDVNNEKEQ